jgi:hypothetical protein
MGDGKFHWYYAVGTTEPEHYYGKCDTREQAIAQARADDGDLYGFVIIEADRSVPTCKVFDADNILEQFQEYNEECWGEDGMELGETPEQRRDLEEMLAAAMDAWFVKHGIERTGYNFDVMRNQETFPAKVPTEAE